jgi:hypothetical protein
MYEKPTAMWNVAAKCAQWHSWILRHFSKLICPNDIHACNGLTHGKVAGFILAELTVLGPVNTTEMAATGASFFEF